MNIDNEFTVIIPTAGLGSRLGEFTQFINKALLPYKNKPVLAHIIEQFPKQTKFLIPVGYKKDQIIDFCSLAYSDRNIEFVHIENYTEDFTGPGYTIKQCLDRITTSFFYIPCDSYFLQNLQNSYEEDTYFVKKVDQNMNMHYTTFHIENNKIKDLQFKQNTDENYFALTGVMYIKDHVAFKSRLLNCQNPEIIYTIEIGSQTEPLDSWIDFGNIDIYKDAVYKSQKYDFTKNDEITFICNNKVIKFWKNENIAEKKYRKYLTNTTVYPNNVQRRNGWISYDYMEGTTLYEYNNTDCFMDMLNWLDKEVWLINNNIDLKADSTAFYKNKTLERVNAFLKKYPDLSEITHVNDIEVSDYRLYLSKIPWEKLSTEVLPAFIHGDLHFDNTIIGKDKKFSIIDWRHEFGNNVEYGDVYYDLAKMCGGFIIDYSKIKENNFKVDIRDTKVYLEVPHAKNYEYYIQNLLDFVDHKGYDIGKVRTLIPIIYWNMSPLHANPFDKFCWYLGILLFQKLLEEEIL